MSSMKRQKDRTLKDELPSLVGAQYATGEDWRNNSRKNKEMGPKQKQCPVVDMTGAKSNVFCFKKTVLHRNLECYSMNQGTLEVIKQEVRVIINILGISELKWTGTSKFNSEDHYIYYYGQESLRRNGVALIVNKRVQSAVLGCNLRNNKVISGHFQGKPFTITVIQVYAQTLMLKKLT